MVEALLEQATWLTPTALFLLLNVVIATILLSSALTTTHPKSPPHIDNGSEPTVAPPPPLARAPSLFSRVTSFNFSNYHPDNNHHQQLRHNYSSPSLFTRVTSFNLSGRAADDHGQDEEVIREGDEVCDTSPLVSDARAPLNKRDSHVDKVCEVNAPLNNDSVLKRVARAPSFLSRVASFPLGMRNLHVDEVGKVNAHNNNNNNNKGKKKVEGDKTATFSKNEEEVDAKADDFINKFKQQLKLQRIESFVRNRSASSVN